ncbi:SPOR domain-containing protein [Homoserinimonas hongtaonis]|uniref:SPOR domain-containing protein n=1 Tax=Homoserinimonas hongtaonis TaxID=2079791 RepID=UPI0011B1D478|nr:SPOR domain-containing protein [Salinibacterium hongtaonis]
MSEWWYNTRTGEVEEGMVSPAIDRAGPFATKEEALAAPAVIAERARKWAEEESRENK